MQLTRLFFLLIALGVTTISFAQKKVLFTALSDAEEVMLGDYFQVTFKLENASGTSFSAPSFKGFNIISGPNKSIQTTMVNGRWSKEVSYSFGLQPKEVGKVKIASASMRVGNKTMRTDPLVITVIPASNNQNKLQDDSEQFYLKAELSSDTALVGQQISLDFVIYTKINIENYNIISVPDYQGFYAQNVRYNSGASRININGSQYTRKILRRMALFPQQTGALTVDPFVLKVGVALNSKKKSRGFFFSKPTKQYTIQSEAVTLKVLDVPRGAPEDFSGAVGKFRMVVNATNKRNLTTDDAITYKIQITGDSDIKRIKGPTFKTIQGIEAYDPQTIKDQNYEQGNKLLGEKIFEYLFIPNEPGLYRLSPSFTYYDTDSSTFVTLRGDEIAYRISQGSVNKSKVPIDLVADKDEQKEMADLMLSTSLSDSKKPFFGSPFFWLFYLLPVVGIIVAAVKRQKKLAEANIDPRLLKAQKAKKIAEARMQEAKTYMDNGNGRAFYDEVNKSLFGYIGDKLNLQLSELSKDNIREKLTSLKVREEHTDTFIDLLKSCELALYAGKVNAEDLKDAYDKSIGIVSKIEEDML